MKSDIMSPKVEGGEEKMHDLQCPNCQGKKRTNTIRVDCDNQAKLTGIIECLVCNYEFPITMQNGSVRKLDIALPGGHSARLNPSVPVDIKDDIKEAEKAYYYLCFSASVAMCRRAMQLGLIDKNIPDTALGKMIEQAYTQSPKILTQDTYTFAKTIKWFGDIGVHRRDKIEGYEVDSVILTAVRVLNELFP